MNHAEAIESNAAESYLLGDLPEAERNAFEAHYIDCRVCSATVQEGATMMAAGQQDAQDAKVKRFTGWNPVTWIPASAAAAAITVVSLYHGVVIPAVQKAASRPFTGEAAIRPQATPLLKAAPRFAGIIQSNDSPDRNTAEPDMPIVFKKNETVELDVEIPTQASEVYSRYRIDLRDTQGDLVATIERPAGEIDDRVTVHLQPVPAGTYVWKVVGIGEDGRSKELYQRSVVVQQGS